MDSVEVSAFSGTELTRRVEARATKLLEQYPPADYFIFRNYPLPEPKSWTQRPGGNPRRGQARKSTGAWSWGK